MIRAILMLFFFLLRSRLISKGIGVESGTIVVDSPSIRCL